MLYYHICNLPKTALSFQVLKEQQRLKLPSVFDEIQPFLSKYGVSDITGFSKKDWSLFVKQKIDLENRNHILELSKNYKKLDYLSLSCETYEVKPYFYKLSLAQSRIKFQERSLTLKHVRLHYPSGKEYLKAAFSCP